MTGDFVIRADKVAKTYQEGKLRTEVLREVSLGVKRGETVAIVGASGTGKSTLLHILGGLDAPTSGEVEVEGKTMSRLSDRARGELRNKSLGFVYQFHHLLPEFTALENVMLPQMIRGLAKKEARKRAAELLSYLGLSERLEHRPSQLSGGEQQRVAIARAVANAPRVLFADEPTGNLDPHTADHVFQALMQLVKATKVSMLIATHNMELAGRMDRRVSLSNGQVVELE